jgi:protein disulfide-isomerase A1
VADSYEEDLESWLKAVSIPTCFKFDDDSVDPIFHQQKAVVFLFLNGDAPFKTTFEKAAAELKGQILFSYSGVTEGFQEQLGEFIGVTPSDLPCIRIMEPALEQVHKYVFEGDVENLSVEAVRNFVAEWKEGKLSPHLNSEEIPEDNNGPVKIVVGKSFHEIVMDETKDVLVKYYAPWCGHC